MPTDQSPDKRELQIIRRTRIILGTLRSVTDVDDDEVLLWAMRASDVSIYHSVEWIALDLAIGTLLHEQRDVSDLRMRQLCLRD
jgi:hypothetical protein